MLLTVVHRWCLDLVYCSILLESTYLHLINVSVVSQSVFCVLLETEVMDEVAQNVSPLEKIVSEIEELAESGGKYNEAPHVIEVTLPMLCRYKHAFNANTILNHVMKLFQCDSFVSV